MEKEIVQKNIAHEQQLKETYNQLAFEQNTSSIQHFFTASENERKEKMVTEIKNWKANADASFDAVWNDIKKNMLIKQEN